MRVRLIPSSGVPIYRQIVDQVGDQIACGRLQAGDRLPSVRELARALPANQNTVIKAYEVLEREGLITRRHGDGTFVASGGSSLSPVQRRGILADLLGHAALKAQFFEVRPPELHQILDQQITSLVPPKERDHG